MRKESNWLTPWPILLSSLLLATLFSGCAPKTKIQAVKPAEVNMPGVRTLAVLPFKGQYGHIVREDFYHKLNEVRHFTLLDLSQNQALDRIQWEQIDDPRNVPEFKQIQADAAVTAFVSTDLKDVQGKDKVQMKEGTGRYRKVKKQNIFTGEEYTAEEEIMRTVLKPVPYVVRTASLSASMKAIDLHTRKILATKKVSRTFKDKYGGKEAYGAYASFSGAKDIKDLPTKEATLNNLARKVATNLVSKIAPTRYTMEVELAKGGSTNFGGGGLVDKGVEHAEKGDWAGAIEYWETGVQQAPHLAPALYNLGVAYEAKGTLEDYLRAKDYYLKACRFGDKEIYLEGKVRISSKIKDARKLQSQRDQLEKSPERKPQGGEVQVY